MKTLNSKIYFIRNQYVMLDKDVADFYSTNLKVFNLARKRKEDLVQDLAFQLTKEEYQNILNLENRKAANQNIPWVYTEKGAYKMAFILDSKTSLKVADLILDIFMEVKNGNFLPSSPQSNITKQLQHRMTIINNFHGPTNLIQGSQNQIVIGPSDQLLLELAKLMSEAKSSENKDALKMLTIALEQTQKKDKLGLMDSIKNLATISQSLSAIHKALPMINHLINLIVW